MSVSWLDENKAPWLPRVVAGRPVEAAQDESLKVLVSPGFVIVAECGVKDAPFPVILNPDHGLLLLATGNTSQAMEFEIRMVFVGVRLIVDLEIIQRSRHWVLLVHNTQIELTSSMRGKPAA